MQSGMFQIHLPDITKALVMAALAGAALPIMAALQTPGFNVFHTDWTAIGRLALNGAMIGFFTYLIKNFFSDTSGAVFGRIGSSSPK